MKKVSIVLLAGLLCTSATFSQDKKKGGFLNKVQNAIDDVGASLDPNNPNPSDLKKDMESKVLESQQVNKDSRNLSGIYYSTEPCRIGLPGTGKYKFAQKFLINYKEGDNVNDVIITSRHYYDKNNDVLPLTHTPRRGTPDYFPITTSVKLGKFLIDGRAESADGHQFMGTFINFADKNGNYISQPSTWVGGLFGDLLELEPGILVSTNLDYIIKANTPEKYKFLQENGKYVIFYKKEKEDKVKSWTKEQVWDMMKEFYTKYYALYKEAEGNNVELAKPIGSFKDEPSNADLKAACLQRMKEMSYYTEEFVYCYPVTSWENRFENVGIMGSTLTHRVLQVQVILKQGDVCKKTQFLIRQDNSYTAGSSVENFKGNKVYCIGDIDKTVIKCDKAMKYKK